MEITFHLSKKFCLFSEEFCLSFRTLLYQFSDFIRHIKCVFQKWNINCIPDSKIKRVAVAGCQQTFDLCNNPIFCSSHDGTSIVALPMGIWNSEIHTQQHIFDANDNLYLHLSEQLATDQYIPRILSSPCPHNVCKLQVVQCC